MIWHPTTFTKNRERLLNEQIMERFLEKLMGAPEVKPLLSDEHFSVDGTLLQAWASHASLERTDGQQDPSLNDGSRRAAVPEIQGTSSAAELPGLCAHGGPPCPDRGLQSHPSDGHR